MGNEASVGMEAFDAVASRTDYPMFVVTAADGGVRAGCLVGFGTQCSIDPPLFLVCLSKANHTFRVACASELLAVHLLAADDRAQAELFGSETGDEVDKFSRCEWSEGPGGVPLLDRCAGWFLGRVVERIDLGDHVGHVLEPVADAGGPFDGGPVVTFQWARTLEPGHPA